MTVNSVTLAESIMAGRFKRTPEQPALITQTLLVAAGSVDIVQKALILLLCDQVTLQTVKWPNGHLLHCPYKNCSALVEQKQSWDLSNNI